MLYITPLQWILITWKRKAIFEQAGSKSVQIYAHSSATKSCSQYTNFFDRHYLLVTLTCLVELKRWPKSQVKCLCRSSRTKKMTQKSSQMSIMGNFLKNGFKVTIRSNENILSCRKHCFSLFCKSLSEKINIF